jgi:hypothetical protein
MSQTTEITRPRMPTTMRITPTVASEMPEMDALTANLRIAPSAMRKSMFLYP